MGDVHNFFLRKVYAYFPNAVFAILHSSLTVTFVYRTYKCVVQHNYSTDIVLNIQEIISPCILLDVCHIRMFKMKSFIYYWDLYWVLSFFLSFFLPLFISFLCEPFWEVWISLQLLMKVSHIKCQQNLCNGLWCKLTWIISFWICVK
jgi:hypothetical protein